MPYKSEKIKIQGTMFDRRRKLTEEQKEEIRKKYATGLIGQRPLAREYGVSRDLIRIIVDSQRAENVRQRQKDHWQEYSNREQLTQAIRETRKYKQQLYLKGEIKHEQT